MQRTSFLLSHDNGFDGQFQELSKSFFSLLDSNANAFRNKETPPRCRYISQILFGEVDSTAPRLFRHFVGMDYDIVMVRRKTINTRLVDELIYCEFYFETNGECPWIFG